MKPRLSSASAWCLLQSYKYKQLCSAQRAPIPSHPISPHPTPPHPTSSYIGSVYTHTRRPGFKRTFLLYQLVCVFRKQRAKRGGSRLYYYAHCNPNKKSCTAVCAPPLFLVFASALLFFFSFFLSLFSLSSPRLPQIFIEIGDEFLVPRELQEQGFVVSSLV